MFPPWEQPTHCTGSATAGALALARWVMEKYGSKGAMNWGIYNCRDIRGGNTTSAHGEGRAFDCGFPLGDPDADQLVKRLLKVPGKLGIQAIIYERRIYSRNHPDGAFYDGEAPHFDHVHIELTREAAQSLTYATISAVLSPPVRQAGSRTLMPGMKGADVKWLQRKLRVEADGDFGHGTARAVEAWKKTWNKRHPNRTPFPTNPNIGRRAWVRLGVKPTYKES